MLYYFGERQSGRCCNVDLEEANLDFSLGKSENTPGDATPLIPNCQAASVIRHRHYCDPTFRSREKASYKIQNKSFYRWSR